MHWKDRSGELQKYVDYWISKDERFRHLQKLDLRVLLCFRDENEWDKDGGAILGKATRLGNKARDIYGCDFMLTFAHNIWRELSRKQRARLVWHELVHCDVESDEDGVVLRDKEGRIKLHLRRHDLVIRSFQEEVEKFGLSAEELPVADFLAKARRRSRVKKR